jgi:hypothetical protein
VATRGWRRVRSAMWCRAMSSISLNVSCMTVLLPGLSAAGG